MQEQLIKNRNHMKWYLKVIRDNYANFSGRARRMEYWMFALINFIASIVLGIVDGATGMMNVEMGIGLLGGIYSLIVLIPGLAVAVRRLHDMGKSGWWLLIAFTGIGLIVLLVFYFMDSQPGENKWGPNPKEVEGGFDETDVAIDENV